MNQLYKYALINVINNLIQKLKHLKLKLLNNLEIRTKIHINKIKMKQNKIIYFLKILINKSYKIEFLEMKCKIFKIVFKIVFKNSNNF